MVEGWILDTYQDSNSEGMVVWIKLDDGSVSKYIFHWAPVLHITGNLDDIDALEVKLKEMEYQTLFGVMKFSRQKRFKSHEANITLRGRYWSMFLRHVVQHYTFLSKT